MPQESLHGIYVLQDWLIGTKVKHKLHLGPWQRSLLCNLSSFSCAGGYLSPGLLPPHPAQAREHLPCQLLLQEAWNPGWSALDGTLKLISFRPTRNAPKNKLSMKIKVLQQESDTGAFLTTSKL